MVQNPKLERGHENHDDIQDVSPAFGKRFFPIMIIGLMVCLLQFYEPKSLTQHWLTFSKTTRNLNTLISGKLSPANNNTTEIAPLMPENPTNLRVLVAVPVYNLKQYSYFEHWLDSLVDLCTCEQMQTLHIVIYTTTVWPIPYLQEIEARTTSCQKHLDFSFSIKLRSPSVKTYLVDEHKSLFYEQINNYDLFVYNEEDINIRPNHIFAYWRETAKLRNKLPADQFADFSLGFLRFEEPHATEFEPTTRYIFENKWDLESPEAFAKKYVISRLIPFTGSYYFNGRDNHHQGMYMATASQLEQWKDRGPSCHFADASRLSNRWGLHRERVSSLHLFDPRGCNVTKILPVDGYQDFLLHHMTNRYWDDGDTFRDQRISTNDLGSMLAAAINFLDRDQKEEEQADSPVVSSGGTRLRGNNGKDHSDMLQPRRKWIQIHKPDDLQDVNLNESAYSEYLPQ